MLQQVMLLSLLQQSFISGIVSASQPPFRGEFGSEPRGLGLLYSITSRGTVGVGGQNQDGVQIQNASLPGVQTTDVNVQIAINQINVSYDRFDTPPGAMPSSMTLAINVTSDVTGVTSVILNLQRNDHVGPGIPVMIGLNNGSIVPEVARTSRQKFAFYADENHAASVKADSINGTLAYSGSFNDRQYQYTFQPTSLSFARRRRRRSFETGGQAYTPDYSVTKSSLDGDQQAFHAPPIRLPVEEDIFVLSERSESGNNGSTDPRLYVVEVLAVIDYRIFLRWYTASSMSTPADKHQDAIDNIRFYYAHVYNGVDMRYQSINSSDYSISVQLVGYYIATSPNASNFIENNRMDGTPLGTVNALGALSSFAGWLANNQKTLPGRDQSTLFTSENMLGTSGNYITGLSVIKGMCSVYSVSICKDAGLYMATETTAHELGHNLGAGHDGVGNTCSYDDQYIMAANSQSLTDRNYRNAFTFSPCSISEFDSFLSTLDSSSRAGDHCLTTIDGAPVNLTSYLGSSLGQRYSPNQQCQLVYGPNSFYCGGRTEDNNICRTMECFHPTYRYCYVQTEQRAFDGTTCGNRSECSFGDCVNNISAPEAADDCVYGDYTGPYSNGMSCATIGSSNPWACYDVNYFDDCCVTCTIMRNDSHPGCEYGDRDTNCGAIRNVNCYNETTRQACCMTCDQFYQRAQIGCEYGDKESWCGNYIQAGTSCYDYAEVCCRTCLQYNVTNITGCEYGNRAKWCDTISASYCYTDSYECCQFCSHLYNSSAVGCEYGDKANWCGTIRAADCYAYSGTCCLSCQQLWRPITGCQYGDKKSNCSSNDCDEPTGKSLCCQTCSYFTVENTTSQLTLSSYMTPTTSASNISTAVPSITVTVQTPSSSPTQSFATNAAVQSLSTSTKDTQTTQSTMSPNTSASTSSQASPTPFSSAGLTPPTNTIIPTSSTVMQTMSSSVNSTSTQSTTSPTSISFSTFSSTSVSVQPSITSTTVSSISDTTTPATSLSTNTPTTISTTSQTMSSPTNTTFFPTTTATSTTTLSPTNTPSTTTTIPLLMSSSTISSSTVKSSTSDPSTITSTVTTTGSSTISFPATTLITSSSTFLPTTTSSSTITTQSTIASSAPIYTQSTTPLASPSTSTTSTVARTSSSMTSIFSQFTSATTANILTSIRATSQSSAIISNTAPMPTNHEITSTKSPNTTVNTTTMSSLLSSNSGRSSASNSPRTIALSSTTDQSQLGSKQCSPDQPSWCNDIDRSECYDVDSWCCSRCANAIYNANTPDCYYGDHYVWCTSAHCSSETLRLACCATCNVTAPTALKSTASTTSTTQQLPTATRAFELGNCRGGDKASYCSALQTLDCYSAAGVCCERCSALYQPVSGCEYGDRVQWCSDYISSISDCLSSSIAFYCCYTCTTLYNVQCTNSVPWCASIYPSMCYDQQMQMNYCCATCKLMRRGNFPDCEYGDKYPWCHLVPGNQCSQYGSTCCQTCSNNSS